MRLIKASEATAARRRIEFHLVGTDGITPATGEAAGQPQISTNGAAWTSTGIGTLTAIGNGRYYADVTQAAVATAGDAIFTRYKSASTAECPGDSVQVVGFDPADFLAEGYGSGVLTVTVDDGAAAILGAAVSLRSGGVLVASGTTDALGQVALSHQGGSAQLLVSRSGYTFDVTALTLTAGQASAQTVSGTAVSVTPAADPSECTLYATLRTLDGEPASGVEGTVRLPTLPATASGNYLSGQSISGTSDVAGLISWTVPRGVRVSVDVPPFVAARVVTVPASATADLSAL
jgi:hypothetical protein